MKEMKQQIAAALLAGVVLTSGVPALAAGVPAGAAPQNAAAVQMHPLRPQNQYRQQQQDK